MSSQPIRLTLFDLDHTLLPLDSDHAWGEFTVALGWRDAATHSRANDAFYAQYQAGTLNIADYVRFATSAAREHGKARADQAHARFMDEVIRPAIKPAALALVQQHLDAGDTVVITSATNEFVTRPIAQAFGVQHLLATELVRDGSGWFTGEIDGIPNMREGKVVRMTEWLTQRGLCWEDVEATFYSDSMNDVPLLEKVDHPVATNPDARLRALAEERGWRIVDLFSEAP